MGNWPRPQGRSTSSQAAWRWEKAPVPLRQTQGAGGVKKATANICMVLSVCRVLNTFSVLTHSISQTTQKEESMSPFYSQRN